MVVQALKWDVAAVTAGDFVDVILCQLAMIDVDDESERRLVVRHNALTFVILSALGSTLSSYSIAILSTVTLGGTASFRKELSE